MNPELISSFKELPSNKKIYFASDFHLGAPNEQESLEREKKIVKWLQQISKDAAAIFLVGDLFDFWFEYKSTVPKGHVRFLGALAELKDLNIPIIIFAGNHDLWMSDYFPQELNIPVYHKPTSIEVNDIKLFIGHGDGLGPGDRRFKFIKRIFTNPIFRLMFQWLHPNLGVGVAKFWSSKSRDFSDQKDQPFNLDSERLYQFCKKTEELDHHDIYIFGHRHLPLQLKISDNSVYYNLGEWINHCTYLEFDGNEASLKSFNP
ncbi:UDP-2,3-diacylglucosamine diphosphatase [Ekhidna sp.]